MKMIRAIVRPEQEEAVLKALEEAGLYAITKFPVLGRGRQRGIQIGSVSYDLLSKVMLLITVTESEYPKALEAITTGGLTGRPGDGKMFVQEVAQSISVRTGKNEVLG